MGDLLAEEESGRSVGSTMEGLSAEESGRSVGSMMGGLLVVVGRSAG